MKVKTIYVAKDGNEFENPNKCIEYEEILKSIDRILKKLPKLPKNDHNKFECGFGYIQHNASNYLNVVDGFYKLACVYYKELNKTIYDSEEFWNTLEYNDSPLWYRGQRLRNIDNKTFREYGQIYYKYHPDQLKSKKQINA